DARRWLRLAPFAYASVELAVSVDEDGEAGGGDGERRWTAFSVRWSGAGRYVVAPAGGGGQGGHGDDDLFALAAAPLEMLLNGNVALAAPAAAPTAAGAAGSSGGGS